MYIITVAHALFPHLWFDYCTLAIHTYKPYIYNNHFKQQSNICIAEPQSWAKSLFKRQTTIFNKIIVIGIWMGFENLCLLFERRSLWTAHENMFDLWIIALPERHQMSCSKKMLVSLYVCFWIKSHCACTCGNEGLLWLLLIIRLNLLRDFEQTLLKL